MKKEYEVVIPKGYLNGRPLLTDIKVKGNWGNYKKEGSIIIYKNSDHHISFVKLENRKWPKKIEVESIGIISFKGGENYIKETEVKNFTFFPVQEKSTFNYFPLSILLLGIVLTVKYRYWFVYQYEKIVFKKRIRMHLLNRDYIGVKKLIESKQGEKFKEKFKLFLIEFDDSLWSPSFDKDKMKNRVAEAVNEL